MKVVILAGGFGTRLSEETHLKPKPMVEIGGKPILWHIMKMYSSYGYNDFVICLGYMGYAIKEYFANYYLHQSNVTFDFRNGNDHVIHSNSAEPWRVTLVDTGLNTMTGGRVKRIQEYIRDEPFMLTYGDGVASIAIDKLVEFHKQQGKLATVTAVQPSGRFGALIVDEVNEKVNSFQEKPKGDGSWINGGFFVLEPDIFKYIEDDSTSMEREPLQDLVKDGKLVAFKHSGFWKPMDTLRDKTELEQLWGSGNAPWKIWS
ncbi:glucose-1-phosphate cytidylyltransferase [Desulfoluna spongiiphila]|uniref:Glucose-1-phosphate cytidylyltransferase n=1 Tax=Desulfoluna spongiiphila TaxID=419481 RepID=A0A1G5JG65_9BACT|nr:glucose-1-phosphate cytidylyltransferase [Desulfoluna spongiiphila]SCY87144.1 glucose-1-phosphate cytidylyltransferase [Desulfoluna spongiiphila]